jgi:pyroglutamyl-peptidase
MRTLLTGFGPFREIIDNPSSRIAAHFEQAGAPGHELTTRVLPVSYDRAAAEVSELLRGGGFDAALLLGVASGPAVLRLERVARRPDGARLRDVDGQVPVDSCPPRHALPFYATTVALELIASTLAAAGLTVRLSEDAGGYVCNHIYYAALHGITTSGLPTRCLFLHVPLDPASLSPPGPEHAMPLEQQILAVGKVLAALHRDASP